MMSDVTPPRVAERDARAAAQKRRRRRCDLEATALPRRPPVAARARRSAESRRTQGGRLITEE
jgi:hypothetical protein